MRLAALVLALLLAFPAVAPAWMGKVYMVHPDVHLTLKTRQGDPVHVRLYGLDCPQGDEPFAGQASDRLRQLVLDKFVEVRTHSVDPDGVVLALVYLVDDMSCLNEELLAEGLCVTSPQGCRDRFCYRFRERQDKAREFGVGMWAQPVGKPIPRDMKPEQ